MKKSLLTIVATFATISCHSSPPEADEPVASDNQLGELVFQLDPSTGTFEQVGFASTVQGIQLNAENDGNPNTGNPDTVEAVTANAGLPGPCGAGEFGGTVTLNSFYDRHTIDNLAVRMEGMAPVSMTANNSDGAQPALGLADEMFGIWLYTGGEGTAEDWCFDIITSEAIAIRVSVYGDLIPVPHRRVFVTSTTHNGDMNEEGGNGLAGGDAICQARADEQSLGGTWVAWLSTDTIDASSRIDDAEHRLVDDTTIVAASLADLTDGEILVAINQTESGGAPAGTPVFTGTQDDGTAFVGTNCLGWTSTDLNDDGYRGLSNHTASRWTADNPRRCDDAQHLYCFETL